MAKMKIKKGDTVEVLSGKDKGRRGVVVRALPAEGKVVVEGVAVAKKAAPGSASPRRAVRSFPTRTRRRAANSHGKPVGKPLREGIS